MKIAILLGESTYPEVLEKACDIRDLYQSFWHGVATSITFFDIRKGNFPQRDFDLYIITGSPASAYDTDLWIEDLKTFIRKKQHEKILGICFGHQVIAEALGGKVEKSNKGWNLGASIMKIQHSTGWMQPEKKEIRMIFNHQDQVTQLPKKAKLLAGNDKVPIQMYAINSNILAMQGHPEYSKEYQVALMYKIQHVINSPQQIQIAEQSYRKNVDSTILRQWIHQFFQS